MPIVSADIMKELDRQTIEEIGIPGAVLMENAGRGATRILCKHFKDLDRRPAVVICGAGNNGGDGFVIARHLQQKGINTKVYLLTAPERIQGDARIYFDVMRKLNIPFEHLAGPTIESNVLSDWRQASCIVDAIFGTGLSRDVTGLYNKAIEGINLSGRPVLAVDMPSGINADNGKVHGIAVEAQCTATFGLPKRGLYLYPGAGYAGIIECLDIGIPKQIIEAHDLEEELLTAATLPGISRLKRKADTHKGTYGHLLVLSGSDGKTGAACLSAMSALRIGAGLVTVGVATSLNPVLEEKLTEVMTLPLPGNVDGSIASSAWGKIQEFAASVQGLVVGPGLGINKNTQVLIRDLWLKIDQPMVFDADALTILSQNVDLAKKQAGEIIITPHPGEMARLLGKSASWVQENRLEAVKTIASAWGVTTVLKGAGTLVADPGGTLRINTTGNAGMASAGMGDVLSGIIGGLLVQGMPPFDAATLGVWLHGAAGDRAAHSIGPIGLLASDLVSRLPEIIKTLIH